jgi:hypothetical protein
MLFFVEIFSNFVIGFWVMKIRGTYCILEGVAEVGQRLLAGCCIVYLMRGGGYCIFRDIF